MREPSEQTASLPHLTARQIVSGTLVLLSVAAAFWLLYQYSVVVIILFGAIVISTAIRPAADRIDLARPYNVVLAYALLIFPLLLALPFAAPTLGDQAARIAGEVPEAYAAIREDMAEHPNFLVWRVARVLPEELAQTEPPQEQPEGQAAPGARPTLGETVGTVGRAIFAFVATLLLSFYWTLDGRRIQQASLLILPQDRRVRAEAILLGAQQKLASFVLGQLLLSAIVGGMALVAYILLELPNALLLAVFAAIGEAIPLIGPGLGAIPAALVAYSIAPEKALWVVLATLIIQQLEAHLLVPRIMHRVVGVHPILSILALTAFGLLFGVAGALVAIPFSAISLYLIRQLVTAEEETAAPSGRDSKSRLRYQLRELEQDVRKHIRSPEEEVDDIEMEIANILERIASDLEHLLVMGEKEERPSP